MVEEPFLRQGAQTVQVEKQTVLVTVVWCDLELASGSESRTVSCSPLSCFGQSTLSQLEEKQVFLEGLLAAKLLHLRLHRVYGHVYFIHTLTALLMAALFCYAALTTS